MIMVENRRAPGGASQTFVPLPRPATCVDAEKVKPVGSLEMSFGFLRSVSARVTIRGRKIGNSLLKERVCARHDIAVEENVAPVFGPFRYLEPP